MANVNPPHVPVPDVEFELEGYGDVPLKFHKKEGGYFLMNFPFGLAKTEEEKANGVMCTVEPARDRRGLTTWNLYAHDILCGTIPSKHLYDDDVMADLATVIAPHPSSLSAAAAADSDSDSDFLKMLHAIEKAGKERDDQLQGQIDKTNARIDRAEACKVKENEVVASVIQSHAQGIRTKEKRIEVVEANQEELREAQIDVEKRLVALEQEESD